MSGSHTVIDACSGGIEIRNLTKRFEEFAAVEDLTLDIAGGSFVAFLGPSGCGKTTTLRMLAGLEVPTSGEILIEGEDVARMSAGARPVGLVPQDYAVFPHMTVRENLGISLTLQHKPAHDVTSSVNEVAQALELNDVLDSWPRSLTQSELQRTAIGRTLVGRPRFVLLDEPLSNLEAGIRARMRAELERIHRRLACTSVYVTHDQVEALALADMIALMKDGRLVQYGTPDEIYSKPATTFVAGFVGSPPMNLIDGHVQSEESRVIVRCGDLSVPVKGNDVERGQGVTIGVRPESILINSEEHPTNGDVCVSGRISVVEPIGSETISLVVGNGWRMTVLEDGMSTRRADEVVSLRISPQLVHLYDSATGDRFDSGLAKEGE